MEDARALSGQLAIAGDQRKRDLVQLLSQSHARFSALCEINCARGYRLGWVESSKEPNKRSFPGGPDDFDAAMGVEQKKYDPDHYIRSRNLKIDFLDEEEGEEEGEEEEEGGEEDAEIVPILAEDPPESPAAVSAPPEVVPSTSEVVVASPAAMVLTEDPSAEGAAPDA